MLLIAACDPPSEFDSHLYVIWENGYYGYINPDGEKVVPCQFDYTVEFREELGAVNVGGHANYRDMPEDGKWGFINRESEFVINPKYLSPVCKAAPFDLHELSLVMHEGYIFSEGLAPVRIKEEWVYITSNDSVAISGLNIQSARRFSEGLAAVYINNKWGYINPDGRVVIEPQFLFPVNFDEGFALVMDSNMNIFCIDKSGQAVFRQYRIESRFHHGIAVIKSGFRGEDIEFEDRLKMGLMDNGGHIVVKPEFDKVLAYSEGLAPALIGSKQEDFIIYQDQIKTQEFDGGRWSFIDSTGKIVLNPIYDDARPYHNGLAAVKRNGKWGYIDHGGNYIFYPQFNIVHDFDGHVAKVKLEDDPYGMYRSHKIAYINERDQKVIWIED